jgi:hypothetical protein
VCVGQRLGITFGLCAMVGRTSGTVVRHSARWL